MRWVACVVVVALLATPAHAQPTPIVMLLPIDGEADAAVRTRLTTTVETSVKVTYPSARSGGTTLAETAAAIGCDPATPECAESVRATLGVDVLIYGRATPRDGQLELVIRQRDKSRQTEVTVLVPSDGGSMSPEARRFLGETIPSCPDNAMPTPDGSCPVKPTAPPKRVRQYRALGITALVGAGVLLLGGLTLWDQASSKQDRIDQAPTNTLADFQALAVLEDEAGRTATYGNVMVLGAIGATAIGIWLLKRDRKVRDAPIVTPAVTASGAGVWVTFTR